MCDCDRRARIHRVVRDISFVCVPFLIVVVVYLALTTMNTMNTVILDFRFFVRTPHRREEKDTRLVLFREPRTRRSTPQHVLSSGGTHGDPVVESDRLDNRTCFLVDVMDEGFDAAYRYCVVVVV